MDAMKPQSNPGTAGRLCRAAIRQFSAVIGPCAVAMGLMAVGMAGAQAASSAASSALESLSTSVGVSSQVISGVLSSASPSRDKVAQGPYRIRTLVREPSGADRDGAWVWLGLEPLGEAAPWTLRLPATVADSAGLGPGQVLQVRHRDYGLGIWPAEAAQPLYLVIDDHLARGFTARPIDSAQAGAAP